MCRMRLLVCSAWLFVLLLSVTLSVDGAISGISRGGRRTQSASAGAANTNKKGGFTRVAELHDGPTEFGMREQLRSQYLNAKQAAQWAANMGSTPRTYTAAERKQHADAARMAQEYALQYVTGFQKQYGEAADAPSAPTSHASSGYDILARQQEKARMAKETTEKQQKQQQQQAAQKQAEQGAYHFAESGVFVEEDAKVKVKSKAKAKGDFEKYEDSSSPPEWLVPSEDAKQGCPTTKPPPVPKMPPPPPPTPTPTWMSPFDEHNTPVFPQSDTPAPFYGMGPPPAGTPGNYLPLDTFLSPGGAEE